MPTYKCKTKISILGNLFYISSCIRGGDTDMYDRVQIKQYFWNEGQLAKLIMFFKNVQMCPKHWEGTGTIILEGLRAGPKDIGVLIYFSVLYGQN